MDAPIIAALIGVFGTGLLAALGFIFTGLRAGIRDNSTRSGRLEAAFVRLEERFGGLEQRVGRFEERTISEFGQIKDVLTRIEATQAEQGRLIEKLSGGDIV